MKANSNKSNARRLMLVGALFLLLLFSGLVPEPLARMILLCLGAVSGGTGGAMYCNATSQQQRYQEQKIRNLRYGNAA